jgi:DNA-binding transcriptional MerR regulator
MTKQAQPIRGNTARSPALSIAAVERDSGISKDTLRAWERRYGFPAPERDASDERIYPPQQVARLRVIKRLLDQGYRPGKILRLAPEALRALTQAAEGSARAAAPAPCAELQDGLDLLRAHRTQELQQWLARALAQHGLARFVAEVAAPMNQRVGDAWARGELQIFEEHLYTESIQLLLRNAIHALPAAAAAPHVLLTTLPVEPHGLGLLMAHALLALKGARVTSLGVGTPLPDVVNAVRAHRAQIVALSFSSLPAARAVTDALSQLRAALPATVAIWAGGGAPVLQRRPLAGVAVLRELADIGPALAAWRSAHPSS